MCKNDVSHILSQMKPNIVILGYGIRKKKNPWWKNLVIRYVQTNSPLQASICLVQIQWEHFFSQEVYINMYSSSFSFS